MSADTNKIVLLREGCVFVARVWKQVSAPVRYEDSVYVNGTWVKVTIGTDHTRDGLQPPTRRAEDREGDE